MEAFKSKNGFLTYLYNIDLLKEILAKFNLSFPTNYESILKFIKEPLASFRGYKIYNFLGRKIINLYLRAHLFKIGGKWPNIDDNIINKHILNLANELRIWKLIEPLKKSEIIKNFSSDKLSEKDKIIKRIEQKENELIQRNPEKFAEILKIDVKKLRSREIEIKWEDITEKQRDQYLQEIITNEMRIEYLYALMTAIFIIYGPNNLEKIIINYIYKIHEKRDNNKELALREENVKDKEYNEIFIDNFINLTSTIIKNWFENRLFNSKYFNDKINEIIIKEINFDKKTFQEIISRFFNSKINFKFDPNHNSLFLPLSDFKKFGKIIFETITAWILHDYFNLENETLLEEKEINNILNHFRKKDYILNCIRENNYNIYMLITNDYEEQKALINSSNIYLDELNMIFYGYLALIFIYYPKMSWNILFYVLSQIIRNDLKYIQDLINENVELINKNFENPGNLLEKWLNQTSNKDNFHLKTYKKSSIFITEITLTLHANNGKLNRRTDFQVNNSITTKGYGRSKKSSKNYAIKKLITILTEKGYMKFQRRTKEIKLKEKLEKDPEKAFYWFISELKRLKISYNHNLKELEQNGKFLFELSLSIGVKKFNSVGSDPIRTIAKKKVFENIFKNKMLIDFIKNNL
ncbi:MAG: hypothetical protein ACP6IY_18235 [Promethearchaeia archaeon]